MLINILFFLFVSRIVSAFDILNNVHFADPSVDLHTIVNNIQDNRVIILYNNKSIALPYIETVNSTYIYNNGGLPQYINNTKVEEYIDNTLKYI